MIEPYLLLITHLFFTSAGKLDNVEQSYRVVDEPISPKDLAEGGNNNWACAFYGERLAETAGEHDAYVWQCVPAAPSE